MNKIFIYLLILIFPFQCFAQNLRVSEDKRYLITADGEPFFWLGDTAWELFHRLDQKEASLYLKNRASKGFNVIQAVVLAELDGLNTPNPYGDTPLLNNDPSKPNEAYFKHVDYIVHTANALGMYIGMLPTWGDKFNKKWGVGPEVFNPENAYAYGKYLGKKYKNDDIIWIMGGDRNPENEEDIQIINSMAKGIKEEAPHQLMTYHPQGGSNSAQFFHNEEWLDFNMFQSGHSEKNIPNYQVTSKLYDLKPVKPVLDGEPSYEDHPVKWDPKHGWFDAFDVRQAAYWSLLSGACGHTYGNHNIWQMWDKEHSPVSSARTPWWQGLDYEGAFQMGYMKIFFESFPWYQLVPESSLVNNQSEIDNYVSASIDRNNNFMIVYIPHGQKLEVNTANLSSDTIKAFWFNPRIGERVNLGKMNKQKIKIFDPPQDPERGNDWVLVIESVDEY